MNGSMCWFEVGHCFLSVVAVNGTTTAQGLNLPQCPQMWTLILVSTNVDTILYLYLRLLTLPIIHSTCSSITIELLSCVSHCFPVHFFISFLVCFSVQVETNTPDSLSYLHTQPVCNYLYRQNCTPSIYKRHSQAGFFPIFLVSCHVSLFLSCHTSNL